MSALQTSPAVAAFEAERRRLLLRQRGEAVIGLLIFSVLLVVSFHRSQFFGSDIGGDPLGRMADFLTRMTPDLKAKALLADRRTEGSLHSWFYDLPLWLRSAWQTVEMAIRATALGAVLALGASFLCAQNLMPFAPVRFVVRRTLEAIRTLPDLIMALILVAAFGVGPLAGVLTLTISTLGSLGKLFAEINEEIDPRQLERPAGRGRSRRSATGCCRRSCPTTPPTPSSGWREISPARRRLAS
ncbi:MAG TPA: hypothetical protein PKB04_06395 [Phenylobacterium sp.]|nr:hypothetical protein [Phenylobacterium sp.]